MNVTEIEQIYTDENGEFIPNTIEVDGSVISITFKDVTDDFDFGDISEDGFLDVSLIETTLEFNPIVFAERNDGTWDVHVIKNIPMPDLFEE